MNKIHRALVSTMILASAADAEMTDEELQSISSIIAQLPVFHGCALDQLGETADACLDQLNQDDGIERLLRQIKADLPSSLYETAYALAVEVAAADMHAGQEELRLLEMFRHSVGIDRLIAAGIERGARARYHPPVKA